MVVGGGSGHYPGLRRWSGGDGARCGAGQHASVPASARQARWPRAAPPAGSWPFGNVRRRAALWVKRSACSNGIRAITLPVNDDTPDEVDKAADGGSESVPLLPDVGSHWTRCARASHANDRTRTLKLAVTCGGGWPVGMELHGEDQRNRGAHDGLAELLVTNSAARPPGRFRQIPAVRGSGSSRGLGTVKIPRAVRRLPPDRPATRRAGRRRHSLEAGLV